MKKYLKGLAAVSLAVVLGVSTVNAATVKKNINTSACDTVYTNYYFFLEANNTNYFGASQLSYISNSNVAKYTNNSYQTYFDSKNVGYGQVRVDKTSSTSRDGITSMSMDDFYSIYKTAYYRSGAYTDGTKNYIVSHDWYKVNGNSWAENNSSMNLVNYSNPALIGASLSANTTITPQTSISYSYANPFEIRIERQFTGYLTGTPITYGSDQWYLQPALYYIQYCSPRYSDSNSDFRVRFNGNADDVTNVPITRTGNYYDGVEIPYVTPVRTGYTFLGWSTDSTATYADRYYAQGQRYYGEDGSITLYAVWRRNNNYNYSYVISYRANTTDSVSNLAQDITIGNESDAYITTSVPVRAGYTFLGWSTDASATVADSRFNGGSLYTDRKDIVLYAVWRKNGQVLPNNPQTGITDYLLPVSSVIAASGTGLGLLRKKKLFKQL